jgi:hypothetical protein
MGCLSKIAVRSLASCLIYCVVAGASLPFASAEDRVTAAAVGGRALTTNELNSLYQDRSWVWKDGAGHFRTENREFTAWVNEGARASYADGSWFVDDKGHLCFHATWHAVRGNKQVLTCFDHRADDKNIYQRKLPNGKWYVFSHLPALPDDEVQKLQPGDHVSEGYQRNKRYVAEHSRGR